MASAIDPIVGRVYRRNRTKALCGDDFDWACGHTLRVASKTSRYVICVVVSGNILDRGTPVNVAKDMFTDKYFDSQPVG